MRSKLYRGTLFHKRFQPRSHEFTYPAYTLAIDLDELSVLDQTCLGFAYNRFSVLSLRSSDYLDPSSGDLKLKVFDFIQKHLNVDLNSRISKVVLVTSPRFLNYVFNPVSFFYCYGETGALEMVLAEVHNTFGEKHLYILDNPLSDSVQTTSFKIDKAFHVSPFFDRSGGYTFRFSLLDQTLSIEIELKKDAQLLLLAVLRGSASPLTTFSLWQSLVPYAWCILLTIPRIAFQAFLLRFFKKLPVFTKPQPDHPLTTRKSSKAMTCWIQRFFMNFGVLKFFNRLHDGHLVMTFPDGSQGKYGDLMGPGYDLEVKDMRFFTRSALFGEIGFGESYMLGEWETSDLSRTLAFFIGNLDIVEGDFTFLRRFFSRFNHFQHHGRRNTLENSKKNIQEHYDLSNELFKLFLDESMTYSSGIFNSPDESLYQAQMNKIHRLIEQVRIGADHHVLEIGCGWGAFAIEAVRRTGCRVTGITLSEEQFAYATQAVSEAGLSDRITILLKDYRQMTGVFDRIVSIEMLEAVGHQFLPVYFQMIDRLLSPNGVVGIQTITIPDHRYEGYRQEADWIKKHIFPGGHLPSIGEIERILQQNTTLALEDAHNIGPHYATTLIRWREAFLKNRDQVLALGFTEEFIRKWVYYFCYCEVGFSTHYAGNFQLVLSRSGGR